MIPMDRRNRLARPPSRRPRWPQLSPPSETDIQITEGGEQEATTSTGDLSSSVFIPTFSDVQRARTLLQACRLPVELVDIVLDYAQYWVVQHFEREEQIHAAASSRQDNRISTLYLLSDPLENPSDEYDSDLLRIRKIVIRLRSHDQGWCTTGGRGTYSGSWTWFEASIFRPLPLSSSPSSSRADPMDLIPTPPANPRECFATPADSIPTLRGEGWEIVPPEMVLPENANEVAWKVQKNVCAYSSPKVHEVVWFELGRADTHENRDDGDDEHENSGAGSGEGFIETLKKGDRIGIWARAMFRGWVNVVEKASLDVYYLV